MSIDVEGRAAGSDGLGPDLDRQHTSVLGEYLLPALELRRFGVEDDTVKIEDDRTWHVTGYLTHMPLRVVFMIAAAVGPHG